MFVIGNLLSALAVVLGFLLQSLMIIILINALLSWVRPDPHNPIVMFLDRVSDLVCNPVRRLFPTAYSGIDFAPFIAMLALWLIQMVVVNSLREAAARLG
ncbi:MAG TPA: YggT family protein [Candidatus Eisenbacteria bacterium]|jgi:YggT family protein